MTEASEFGKAIAILRSPIMTRRQLDEKLNLTSGTIEGLENAPEGDVDAVLYHAAAHHWMTVDGMIGAIAAALDGNVDELILLAKRIPPRYRNVVNQDAIAALHMLESLKNGQSITEFGLGPK